MGEVKRRLLAAEHQRDLRELLASAFSLEEYAVSTAADGGDGAPRVVMLTAHGTPTHVTKAMALGVREFIGKPFDLDQLLRVVADERTEATPPPREE